MRPGVNLIIFEEDLSRINACLTTLHHQARSKAVLLIDRNGQFIASTGETASLDTTSLATLAAGNMAAAGGLAQVVGEREFSILFHEGEREHVHISVIGGRVILIVLFDHRSSLGLVRFRVKISSREIEGIFDELTRRLERDGEQSRTLRESGFTEITDEDIENLFGMG
ncbi:MAG: roadblock/LC7 domain-containing protein [Candidatus Methylomirabilales bacterium]